MALRRYKFAVGDYVCTSKDATPRRINTTLFLETDDTYQYNVDGLGWIYEKDLILVKTHLQMLSEKRASSAI